MSIILKGIDLPSNAKVELIVKSPTESFRKQIPKSRVIQVPKVCGMLVEEHYPGELKAKHPQGVFIMYRSADEDTDRFILEAEAEK